jgi:hypothetical protein
LAQQRGVEIQRSSRGAVWAERVVRRSLVVRVTGRLRSSEPAPEVRGERSVDNKIVIRFDIQDDAFHDIAFADCDLTGSECFADQIRSRGIEARQI